LKGARECAPLENIRLGRKMLARDKHSSLLCHWISDEENKFKTSISDVNVKKRFSFVADDEAK
jgi:hypothetical protein